MVGDTELCSSDQRRMMMMMMMKDGMTTVRYE